MKGYRLLAGLLLCTSLSSCFKDEPLNAECDITQVSFHLDNPLGTFFSLSDTLRSVASSDSIITVNVRRNHEADLSVLRPNLTLTPGATAELLDDQVTSDQGGKLYYRITSEDQVWRRNYTIAITPVLRTVSDTLTFDFETFELESREHKYYTWQNVREDGTIANDWANGNPGFRLSMGSAAPEDYPSTPLAQGYSGYGLQLITRSTGPFGAMAGKRLAAGNFFYGTFDVSIALKDALHATHFGQPFDRAPVTLTGYYTYEPGATYQDKDGNTVAGRTDQGAIYAVLYRNHDSEGNQVTLNGEDVKTSPLIVAMADMGTVKPTTTWTAFSLPFVYSADIDYTLLENQGYSLAIVFSSSDEGEKFEGAIGSRLCIDQVSVICQKEQ